MNATDDITTEESSAVTLEHFTASKEALADMRKRIAATRWPDKETVNDAIIWTA
jgi:hypothetical protein